MLMSHPKPRIDRSTAAHDTEQTHVINALTLIGSTSNGVSCRSESDLAFPARGVWLRSRDPEISSVMSFFLFFVVCCHCAWVVAALYFYFCYCFAVVL